MSPIVRQVVLHKDKIQVAQHWDIMYRLPSRRRGEGKKRDKHYGRLFLVKFTPVLITFIFCFVNFKISFCS